MSLSVIFEAALLLNGTLYFEIPFANLLIALRGDRLY